MCSISSGTASESGDDPPLRYPLLERAVDIFLRPRHLFREIKRQPRSLAATLLSTGILTVTGLLGIYTMQVRLSPGLVATTILLQGCVFWAYLGVVALSGMAFGGFTSIDLSYRHWFSLAAHCSLVNFFFLPLQLAAMLWTGDAAVQLSAADLIEAGGATQGFLSRVSLRSLGFLMLFSLGASVFTGAHFTRAALFVITTWTGFWFMLAWLGACGSYLAVLQTHEGI
jgi:hypothetical protein